MKHGENKQTPDTDPRVESNRQDHCAIMSAMITIYLLYIYSICRDLHEMEYTETNRFTHLCKISAPHLSVNIRVYLFSDDNL